MSTTRPYIIHHHVLNILENFQAKELGVVCIFAILLAFQSILVYLSLILGHVIGATSITIVLCLKEDNRHKLVLLFQALR